MKLVRKTALAAALAVVSMAALATVTFNPATGTGFVGKGDVQNAFAWNNAALQQNIGGISFSYNSSVTYSGTCYWVTGPVQNRTEHTVTHTTETNVNGTVNWDARTHHQVDGIYLTGFGDTTEGGGDIPVVGGPCPGNPGTGAVYIDVQVVPGGSTGGLYVYYNDGPGVLLGNF